MKQRHFEMVKTNGVTLRTVVEGKGPLVVLSRTAEGLVQRLIEFQVPEIQDDIVEIMAIAREPGSRSKVAVHSKRPEVDAVGACLGPKSSRIANVSDELRGEKIDVIRWAPDPETFISNALAPAQASRNAAASVTSTW